MEAARTHFAYPSSLRDDLAFLAFFYFCVASSSLLDPMFIDLHGACFLPAASPEPTHGAMPNFRDGIRQQFRGRRPCQKREIADASTCERPSALASNASSIHVSSPSELSELSSATHYMLVTHWNPSSMENARGEKLSRLMGDKRTSKAIAAPRGLTTWNPRYLSFQPNYDSNAQSESTRAPTLGHSNRVVAQGFANDWRLLSLFRGNSTSAWLDSTMSNTAFPNRPTFCPE
ncbi:hypothetical protein GLAREA_09682 [Glarea lozoyensis ATCC 20868]|uniref:Uncharacterized protein n=1 Tax=Glarea lozoyensis (strain ATCC 20868 / MF5171) TaxID=1116229 RepID=S3D986_GLAL2|nr:uncharacterized protein GLAREA_09682 [Glarea lozoyensis ATCC 20868]EPE28561.1 hypothetical protein GLAREA_09682 [Glarea lozoyensis ATCC 20868]